MFPQEEEEEGGFIGESGAGKCVRQVPAELAMAIERRIAPPRRDPPTRRRGAA